MPGCAICATERARLRKQVTLDPDGGVPDRCASGNPRAVQGASW